MSLPKTGIIFIGPVCAGKSTQGKLVAKAIGKKSLSLDGVAKKYYEANGFGQSQFQKTIKENGFLEAYRQWQPSFAYAAQQVVKDYPDCVIDFGAGHSHYEDNSLFESVKEALSEYSNVIFLLPSPDLERSVSVIRERSIQQRGWNWIVDGYDFIEHWVKDDCNHRLAKMTIYTDGKTPKETRDEILQAIKQSSNQAIKL